MTLDELRELAEKIRSDAAQVTDEQLGQARDAIQKHVADAKKAGASAETNRLLTDLQPVKGAVDGEITSRATAKAETESETSRLLEELGRVADITPGGAEDADAEVVELPVAEDADSEPVAVAASGFSGAQAAQIAKTAADSAVAAFTALQGKPASQGLPAAEPQGRPARVTAQPAALAAQPQTEQVRLRVHAAGSDGTRQHGQEISNTADLGRVFADRLRGASGRGADGRVYVATVASEYPESRILRGTDADVSGNFAKIQDVTSPQALVAAGGLCAPLQTLYDVDVVGSTARPFRDALARFNVERGGITYRPNSSAAAAVYGAGVWTMNDDAADPVGSKGCYVVDCPDPQEAVVEAIYLCLEFSNVTSRFDPEVTAANVQLGSIAHARLAENRLLAKVAAGSKALSAPKVIGATRDILVNLDKAVAYYRNRHRIDEAVSLTFVLPGWVKSMMRADIARQMAAGDWMLALAVADAKIASWFSDRGVSIVWHLDGPAGLDEVQTVTITGTPTGGTFTLTYSGQTTAAIAYNATAATVKAALAALSNIKPEDIQVAGGPGPGTPWTVTFSGGAADGHNVAQMTATGSLTGGTTPAVAVTTTTGGGGAITVNGISIASQTYPEAAAGDVLPGFPDQIDSLLFTSGSWLFLDGGNLDLGLVRDSTLNDRNRYRQFMETFEGAAFRGIESLRMVMTVQPTGQTSGTKDLDAIAD
jgi:hypothetical protein